MRTSLLFAGLVALVLLATPGRPFWWSAVGFAAAAGVALAFAPAEVRRRGLPLAAALAAVAIVALVPVFAL